MSGPIPLLTSYKKRPGRPTRVSRWARRGSCWSTTRPNLLAIQADIKMCSWSL